MHAYLPAIGFGQIKKKSQLQQLLSSVQNFPDQVQKIRLDEESSLVVYTKEVAPDIGLMICGEEDMQGSFQMEYYEPYINSNVCSSKAECSIEKESARESYDGVCDDCRLGLNLIFSVNNFMEYRKYKVLQGFFPTVTDACLSALCTQGKILLPILKRPEAARIAKKKEQGRQKLIEAAREGNQEAIDSLTIDDMNLSNKVGRLLNSCDIYTMVESSIMPCGMESDRYTIIGEILNVVPLVNEISKEPLCQMDVKCNNICIRVLVNRSGLMGEPMAGRRFKGDIWLQGVVNFV